MVGGGNGSRRGGGTPRQKKCLGMTRDHGVPEKKMSRRSARQDSRRLSLSRILSWSCPEKKSGAHPAGRGTGTNDGGRLAAAAMAKIRTYLKKMIIINPQYPPQREMVVGADGYYGRRGVCRGIGYGQRRQWRLLSMPCCCCSCSCLLLLLLLLA